MTKEVEERMALLGKKSQASRDKTGFRPGWVRGKNKWAGPDSEAARCGKGTPDGSHPPPYLSLSLSPSSAPCSSFLSSPSPSLSFSLLGSSKPYPLNKIPPSLSPLPVPRSPPSQQPLTACPTLGSFYTCPSFIVIGVGEECGVWSVE